MPTQNDRLELLSTVLEYTSEGVVACDEEGKLTYFNRATREFHGLPAEEMEPENWADHYQLFEVNGLTPMAKENVPPYRALRGEVVQSALMVIAPKGRSQILVSCSGEAFRDESGKVTGAVISMKDITETTRIAQELLILNRTLEGRLLDQTEAERSRFKFLAEVSSVLQSSLDPSELLSTLSSAVIKDFADGCFIDLVENGAHRRVITRHRIPELETIMLEMQNQFPPSPTSPHPASSAIRSGKSELLRELDAAAIESHTMHPDHAALIRKLAVRTHIAIPFTIRGKVIGAFSLFRSGENADPYNDADVDTGEEIARRAAIAVDNARLYADTRKALQQRDEFISVASHELKTPITSLKLQAQLAARRLADPKQAEKFGKGSILSLVDLFNRQLDRLSRLVEDMLDISRIATGKVSLVKHSTDLASLTLEVVERFRLQFSAMGIAVDFHSDGELAHAKSNPRGREKRV